MGPPESCYGLWYYPEINRFIDEDGTILHDFDDLFDIWQINEWRKTRDYGILLDKKGDLCELHYVNISKDLFCDGYCEECANPCKIYDLWKNWELERSYI